MADVREPGIQCELYRECWVDRRYDPSHARISQKLSRRQDSHSPGYEEGPNDDYRTVKEGVNGIHRHSDDDSRSPDDGYELPDDGSGPPSYFLFVQVWWTCEPIWGTSRDYISLCTYCMSTVRLILS